MSLIVPAGYDDLPSCSEHHRSVTTSLTPNPLRAAGAIDEIALLQLLQMLYLAIDEHAVGVVDEPVRAVHGHAPLARAAHMVLQLQHNLYRVGEHKNSRQCCERRRLEIAIEALYTQTGCCNHYGITLQMHGPCG